VRLLLATKTQQPDAVVAAVHAAQGLGHEVLVGENRVQELTAKGETFRSSGCVPHLIGPLQSNKVNRALDVLLSPGPVGCLQSVASLDLAARVGQRAVARGRTLDVMVQVNVSGEPTKSGVAPPDAVGLAVQVARVPGLRLVGFMTIGARTEQDARVRAGFAALRAVRDATLATGSAGTQDAHELSMGMSHDLEAAIAEGATTVRVGSAVFGPRATPTEDTSTAHSR